MRTDVPNSATRVENEPAEHVKNDPKVNNNFDDQNPANELCESSSETIHDNNVICSTLARKPVDRYGAVLFK